MVPDASSRASLTGEEARKERDRLITLLDATALHHYRARSIGEQREITVKAALPDNATPRPFVQVSAQTDRK
jgi:hypothetical protein